jgi:hypothetical protein
VVAFITQLDLTPSDVMLLLAVLPAAWFWASYGLGSPWYRSTLGVVTFLHSLSVASLLFLIVYAIVFGQRVDEPWRLMVSTVLFFALTSKVVILHVERRAGRIERRRARARAAASKLSRELT